MAQVHTVRPKTKTRQSRRVGRGGKRGTYSGRGMKGQKSRSGARIRPQIRDMIKRIPKLRGDNTSPPPGPRPMTIPLSLLARGFGEGTSVTPKTLKATGLIKSVRVPVKIVGVGGAPKKVKIVGVAVSSAARKAIEDAGGSVA